MRRLLYALIGYPTAGIGIYYTFFGNQNFYGIFILVLGLFGILSDICYKKFRLG